MTVTTERQTELPGKATSVPVGEPLLRTAGLTKSFAGNVVLNNVGFDVQAGEIHALVGENGAGKSTWINLVTGVYQPDMGRIEIAGESLSHLTPRQAESFGISTVHQELSLCPHLTVAENVYLGQTPTTALNQIDYQRIEDGSAAIFAELGISIDPRSLAGELPLAEQQLVEFARSTCSSGRCGGSGTGESASSSSPTGWMKSLR
jgi:ribose transport system ATP-binding protein